MTRFLFFLALAIVTAAAIILLWYVSPRRIVAARNITPASPASPTALDAEDKVRTSIGQLITAISVVIGIFITIYQLQANQRSQIDQQATTLLVEGIKSLGGEKGNDYGRAAAVYEIQNVMLENAKYQKVVVSILIAFIRSSRSQENSPDCDIKAVSDAPDVQAAIDVIGNRPAPSPDQTPKLDLSRLCLFGADFTLQNWHGATFYKSDLRQSVFDGADVTEAAFSEANFDYWSVPGVIAEEHEIGPFSTLPEYRQLNILSRFRGANARRATFGGTCLRGVEFDGASLKGSTFKGASISLASFLGASGLVSADQFKESCSRQASFNFPDSITIPQCPEGRDKCDDFTHFAAPASPQKSNHSIHEAN